MDSILRILRNGALMLVPAGVFGFIGFHMGQHLQGSPAAPFALVAGLIAVGGVWWWTKRHL